MKRIVLVLFAVLAAAAHADRVRLMVRGSADAERVGDAPVTAGIAWPRGALRQTESLRLLDRGDRELPLQVRTLARWPDGSVQWTLLDFQAALRRTAPVAFVLDTGAAPRKAAPAHPVEVRESADHVTVATGAATFRIPRKGFTLFDRVTLAGEASPLLEADDPADGICLEPSEERATVPCPPEATHVALPAADRVFLGRHALGARWLRGRGFRVVDPATGKELEAQVGGASFGPDAKQSAVGHGWCSSVVVHLDRAPGAPAAIAYPRAAAKPRRFCSSLGPAKLTVETRGPLRSVVRAEGRFHASHGAALGHYTARLHFFAGRPFVRIGLTVVNREALPPSRGLETYPLLVNDLTLRLSLRVRGVLHWRFAEETGLRASHRGRMVAGQRAKLVQYRSRTLRRGRYIVTKDGVELDADRRAGGGMSLWGATRGAAVCVRRIALNNPKALRAFGDGRIEIGIFPREAGPCEEFLAGRARTHDLLVWFHGQDTPPLGDVTAAFNGSVAASPLHEDELGVSGRWHAAAAAETIAPLGAASYDLTFPDHFKQAIARRDTHGACGMWNHGDRALRPCRLVNASVDAAQPTSIRADDLAGVPHLAGLALLVASGKASAANRRDPLLVVASDPRTGTVSFAEPFERVPDTGDHIVLYEPHGPFLCHRFDPACALAREFLRRGDPMLLAEAHAAARHLADVGTLHATEGGDPRWVGAPHDPALGPTDHHAPGLGPEGSWYAGAWLTLLLTGDRVVLDAALRNAAFLARRADDPKVSPLASALAVVNLCYAADVAPALAPEQAPVFQAALDTYVGRLLDAQRRSGHGLFDDRGAAAGICLEALERANARQPDARIPPALLRAAQALIRPDGFWADHAAGHPADGLVDDWARRPHQSVHGGPAALAAPALAHAAEAAADTRFIRKARRLERVAALLPCDGPVRFTCRYRRGDLFAAAWQRTLEKHPHPAPTETTFLSRLGNAADVALPDLGVGGAVAFSRFAVLPDGSRAWAAQAPADGAARADAGLRIPLLDSRNVLRSQGAIAFRIRYRKEPPKRQTHWLRTGDLTDHGLALSFGPQGLVLTSRYHGRGHVALAAPDVALEPGAWHRVAIAWARTAGCDLTFDGRKLAHSDQGHLGLGRVLRLPCHPDADYLVADLRIWRKPRDEPAAADAVAPAPIADLMLVPAEAGRMLLSWTAPGDDGRTGRARRYDVRMSSQRIGPLSWGGHAGLGPALAAIRWAEADRIQPVPQPRAAGELEKLLVGPFPEGRRVYIAVRAEDEANLSPLGNVVANEANHPPVADAGPPERRAIVGSTVVFDGRRSSDPDDDDLTWSWSNGIRGPTGSLPYPKAGTHTVTLTVSDGKATATAATRLVVASAVRVSFQPRGAARTPAGFLPDEGLVYGRARGYGWHSLPRGTQGFTRTQPAELPPEARTGLSVPAPAEWGFDLPSGTYTVALSAGDPAQRRGRCRVLVEGAEAPLTGQRAPFVLADHRVDVADGQLTVRIEPLPDPTAPAAPRAWINTLLIQRQ